MLEITSFTPSSKEVEWAGAGIVDTQVSAFNSGLDKLRKITLAWIWAKPKILWGDQTPAKRHKVRR